MQNCNMEVLDFEQDRLQTPLSGWIMIAEQQAHVVAPKQAQTGPSCELWDLLAISVSYQGERMPKLKMLLLLGAGAYGAQEG